MELSHLKMYQTYSRCLGSLIYFKRSLYQTYSRCLGYTINTTDVIKNIHGFRKSGEAIVETENNPQRDLFAYEPESKHINYIGISGMQYVFSVSSYFETLLLLDQ